MTEQATITVKNTMATAGMTIGIVAASLSIIPLVSIVALPLGLVGAPLSGLGLVKARHTDVGKGHAIAGIALNIVALIFWFAWAALFGAAIADA